MKWKISVRTALILACVALILLTMICQIGFNIYFGKSFAYFDKEREIQELYTLISENYSDDPQFLYELVGSAQRDKNLRIQIFSPDKIIYNSDMMDNPRLSDMNWEHHIPPQVGFPAVETNKTMVRLEETIEFQGEMRTIVIWTSVAAIEESVELFTKSNLIVSFVVLILAVFIVIFGSKKLIRPLRDIEIVAKNVADLDFSTKAQESVSLVELESLAKSINTMSDSLASMIEKLSQDNANLINKVEYQQKLEQMRRQFVANISHEMKTPLSMVMMYSESLEMDIPGIDKTHYCQTIREEAAGLNSMVEQLLDISSVENGLSKIQRKQLNFSQFASQTVEKTMVLLEQFQVVVNIQPDVWVDGDVKYLEQAIRNYMANAKAHTPLGGEIFITVKTGEDSAVFSVKNRGNPITNEDLPHIWESFYRGDKSRTQHGAKRVGLGLYLVKTCIQAHNGTVFAENLDGFVEFSFQIPISKNSVRNADNLNVYV